MKRFITLFLLCVLSLSFYKASAGTSTELNKSTRLLLPAQDESDNVKGKLFITAGIAFNIFSIEQLARYTSSPLYLDSSNFGFDYATYRSTPLFHGLVDYGIAKKFTIGIGFGYQKNTVADWEHDEYNPFTGYYDRYYYTDKWTRINIGARGLFHMVRTERISLYAGMRISGNMYTHSTNYGDSRYFTKLKVHPAPVSVQVLFGFSVFVTKNLGFNTELGLGGPYFFSLGLTSKFGGK